MDFFIFRVKTLQLQKSYKPKITASAVSPKFTGTRQAQRLTSVINHPERRELSGKLEANEFENRRG